MHRGYIKLRRQSQDSKLYFADPFTRWQAWQDLLLNTNHKDGVIIVRGNIINLKRGQNGYSETTLAVRRKWSRGKVRRFLKYLETVQQIVQHKSKVKSIITINNYDMYQGNGTTDSTTDGHQTVQQTDTNKNVKKDKNVKNKDVPPKNPSSTKQILSEKKGKDAVKIEDILGYDIFIDKYGKEMLEEFIEYRTAPTASGKQVRQEQTTFDIGRRLVTWYRRGKSYKKKYELEKTYENFVDLLKKDKFPEAKEMAGKDYGKRYTKYLLNDFTG